MNSVNIQNRIFTIRGAKVMIDFHLAELYNVETKALNQAVKRNLRRFPDDFMFQLTAKEWQSLKDGISISNAETNHIWSQIVTTSTRRKGYSPFAFTEPGVATFQCSKI